MGALPNPQHHAITFVVGPTAAGKSHWAIQEAEKSGGVIVNADSVQFFKYLNIGTAKPSQQEQKLVPHLLYDFIEPNKEFTAGDYRRAALRVIHENIGDRPLYFVGGSGFYLRALEKGMFNVKPISSDIKSRVESLRNQQSLYTELLKIDPQSAERIGRNDPYRLERALELVLSEGRTVKQIEIEFQSSGPSLGDLYRLKKIGIVCDRVNLRRRIERRTAKMLNDGFIEEVESLIKQGYGETKALRSVGYKEVCTYLKGGMLRNELPAAIVTSTMRLAKKQMTWFKRDREIAWMGSQ